MKSSIAGTVLAGSFLLATIAYAQAGAVPIGDPFRRIANRRAKLKGVMEGKT